MVASVPSGSVAGLDHAQPEVLEAARAGSGRCRAALAISSAPSERMMRSAPSAAPDRRRHRRGGEDERRARRSAGTRSPRSGPAMKPPQDARLFENVPIRRSTSVLEPEQLAGPGAARAEHADAVRLVDHQPRAVALGTARRSPAGRRGRPPSRRRRRRPPGRRRRRRRRARASARASSIWLWRKGRSLRAREPAAVEDRGVVAGVADHRVARARGSSRCSRGWPGSRW